jgi:hypothetical protein
VFLAKYHKKHKEDSFEVKQQQETKKKMSFCKKNDGGARKFLVMRGSMY